MIKKKMYLVIVSLVLVIMLGTITYAFFNYTRAGVASTIKTGRIYFNTTQDRTLSLTNVFPVASNSVGNDYTEDTLQIEITGDTTYGDGIEYLVTAESVNVETSTGKKVPMTLKLGVTDDLGTEDTDQDEIEYFADRGSTTSMYKILSESVLYDGQYLLVGYIAPGATGIDGTINIKAYLDETRVAISDTYPEGEVSHVEGVEPNEETIIDGYNGTTSNWVNGRVVLTTNEWNSLSEQGHELSFKVKVEANEGIWIDPATNPNSAGSIPTELKDNITEIHFIKETPIRMERRYDAATVKADMTDTTLNEGKVLAWQEDDKLYIASSGETYLPNNSANYFAGLGVTTIDFGNINTSRVTIMAGMFSGCSSLEEIDLSKIDTSHVIYMSSMFYGCSSLEEIDLSGHGNSSLNNLGGIFSGCNSLKTINMSDFIFGNNASGVFQGLGQVETINLSNADTSRITNMAGMFAGGSNLKSIDLSGIDTSNVTSMQGMFRDCSELVTISLIDLGSNVLSNVTEMFSGCVNLKEINMNEFNFGTVNALNTMSLSSISKLEKFSISGASTSNIQYLTYMFSGCTNLKEVDFTNISMPKNLYMQGMFNNCSSLTNVDLSQLTANSVSDISKIFNGCTNLISVNLSNLGGDGLSNIDMMFYGCTNLKEINMSGFNFGLIENLNEGYSPFVNLTNVEIINLSNANASNVTNMSYMFASRNNLKQLYLSNFDSSNVSNMNYMFAGCNKLEVIDLNNFNTSKVTSMEAMFSNCESLVSLDLSDFDTSNVSSMYQMFMNCNNLKNLDISTFNTSKVTSMNSMFYNCDSIENLDLSSFNLGYITSMNEMFSSCDNLTHIYVSNIWNANNVSSAYNMFSGCLSLVGGQGTMYNATNSNDKTYAHIDGGPSNPGYLTLKTN